MQQILFRHLVVFAALLTCVTARSEGDLKNPINRIFSTIKVSRDHSISPMRLCHNGRYIFFKDKKNCDEFFIPGFDCDSNPAIAPLRSSEKIFLNEGGQDFITRFFHIDSQYYYQEVDVNSGVLLKSEKRQIPVCANRKSESTENVLTKRVVRSQSEKIFIASLINQSKKQNEVPFLIINSPIGNADEFEQFSIEDIDGQPSLSLTQHPVKTPFCSGFNTDLIWQMSGEYTGGGSRGLKPASLQLISQPLFVKKKIFVVDKETKQLEHRYEFTCEPVWDI